MVSAYMFQNIRNLKEQGKSQAEIARELDLDPKTVAKYVRANSPPRYKKREKSTREEFVFG
jgi:transcriptional regulator with XRE-family HTH domain